MAVSGNITSLLGFHSKPFPLTIGCPRGSFDAYGTMAPNTKQLQLGVNVFSSNKKCNLWPSDCFSAARTGA